MTKRTRLPKYCLHKGTGQAYSRVKGQFVYHGDYDTEASRENYDKFVAEFLTAGRKLPRKEGLGFADVSINSLCLGYLKHAESYGYSHKELEAYKVAVRRFRKVYGRTLVENFGPLNLKAFQQSLVEAECSRMYVNKTVERIVRIFKWGTAEELVPSGIYEALKAVEGLKKGRTTAHDYDPVKPVSTINIKKTVKHLQRIPSDMVWFQRYTGCRSGEMVIMRPCDIDQSGDVWIYSPSTHKTEHHGKSRSVYIGPKAQAVLLPYLEDRSPESYIFSPKEAAEERSKTLREARRSKITPSQKEREKQAKRRGRNNLGDRYTPDSFRRAITRACKMAGVDEWSPHQLRHSAATEFRKKFGLEASQVLLGHSSANITEIYAETDKDRAVSAIKEAG